MISGPKDWIRQWTAISLSWLLALSLFVATAYCPDFQFGSDFLLLEDSNSQWVLVPISDCRDDASPQTHKDHLDDCSFHGLNKLIGLPQTSGVSLHASDCSKAKLPPSNPKLASPWLALGFARGPPLAIDFV